MAREAAIEVRDLRKAFGDVQALCGMVIFPLTFASFAFVPPELLSVLWCLGLIAVFSALSVHSYRRAVST